MPDSAEDAGRLLRRAGRVLVEEAARVDVDAAGVRSPLGVDVARQLRRAVPDGWEVSTGSLRFPARSGEVVLGPTVVVHRHPEPDGGLPAPPALCVSVAPARLDRRSARFYAHFGVDHYWHLDSCSGVLEVLVRVDDEYRHAETITIPVGTGPGDGAAEWVDFGIGIVRLALDVDTAQHGAPSGA